jgi:hypothetical protein
MTCSSVFNNRNILVNNGKLSSLFTKWKHYTLRTNEQLESKNGKYILRMEPNCNLVLSLKGTKKALFETLTAGKGKNCKAVLHKNGNFSVRSGNKQVLWSTNTVAVGGGPYRLKLRNSGNLVLIHKKACKWASKTCPLPRKFKGLPKKKALRKIKKDLKKKLKKLHDTNFFFFTCYCAIEEFNMSFKALNNHSLVSTK